MPFPNRFSSKTNGTIRKKLIVPLEGAFEMLYPFEDGVYFGNHDVKIKMMKSL
jgi:hypothetical protein